MLVGIGVFQQDKDYQVQDQQLVKQEKWEEQRSIGGIIQLCGRILRPQAGVAIFGGISTPTRAMR